MHPYFFDAICSPFLGLTTMGSAGHVFSPNQSLSYFMNAPPSIFFRLHNDAQRVESPVCRRGQLRWDSDGRRVTRVVWMAGHAPKNNLYRDHDEV